MTQRVKVPARKAEPVKENAKIIAVRPRLGGFYVSGKKEKLSLLMPLIPQQRLENVRKRHFAVRTGSFGATNDQTAAPLAVDDISRVDGVQRDERTARLILRAWSRNISTLAKKSTMRADLVASEEYNLSMDTFDDYVGAFNKLFVISDLEAWCPPIRSKSAIRSGLKREFTDPSIAVAALGATPESLQTQLKTFGFIFENMCARDIKAYSQNLGGALSYYHDRYGLESDLVLHLGDGRYALIECKLGSQEIEEGAAHLKEIVQLIHEHNLIEKQVPIREPDHLIVLTGGTMAYTREDGVKIIPLGCLKW